jgi:hypothetical protein
LSWRAGVAAVEDLFSRQETLRQRAGEIEIGLTAAAARRELVDRQLREAHQIDKVFVELTEAQLKYAETEVRRAEIDTLDQRLEHARSAEALRDAEIYCQQRNRNMKRCFSKRTFAQHERALEAKQVAGVNWRPNSRDAGTSLAGGDRAPEALTGKIEELEQRK